MINLPDVTLVAISSIEISNTIKALEYSSENIRFGDIKLLSHEEPNEKLKNIKYEHIPKISNINDFNEFMFLDLGDHIQTKYCLTIQYHGYIINSNKWTNEYLDYSYIGAPWPISQNTYIGNDGTQSRVGNGGFSLRDRIVLDTPKKENWIIREERNWKNEDGQICCYYKREFLEHGIKYAPLELALTFSFENRVPEYDGRSTFGYHRNYPWYQFL